VAEREKERNMDRDRQR